MIPTLNASDTRPRSSHAGGVGLQLLGIGANGHIGFNEPASELIARTHRVTLLEATRRANAALFGGDETRVPREALTMGIGTILKAEAVISDRQREWQGGERRADGARADHHARARVVLADASTR